MNCPKCSTKLRKVRVKVAGAKQRAISYQCPNCDYFEFEPNTSKIIKDIRESHKQT